MKWKIIDTGTATAEKNMAIDYALLRDLPNAEQPILHLYDWEGKAATYGHFLDPYKYLDWEAVAKHSIQLARRPTGGGVIFHLADFAFSILIPASHPHFTLNTLDNYAYINRHVAQLIQKLLKTEIMPELLIDDPMARHEDAKYFCMAKPTRNDVMWNGKKIAGGAQRRTKYGYLHQGTISLGMPDEGLLCEVLKSNALIEDMLRNGFYDTGKVSELKSELREAFVSREFL